MASGQNGARRDLVIAIDRSQTLATSDANRHKSDADNLDTAQHILEKLAAEATADPQTAPRVGVVMFSGDGNCSEWTAGQITAGTEFPCLYVPAAPLSDATHLQNLSAFLQAAEGQYAEGSLTLSGDVTIPLSLITNNQMGLTPAQPAGMVLFTDAHDYVGISGDVYADLEVESYQNGESIATKAFAAAQSQVKIVLALAPTPTPAFDQTYADAYSNMCTPFRPAFATDCAAPVAQNNPSTWPVNNIDFHAFAASLVAAAGGAAQDVVDLQSATDVDAALDDLRIQNATGSVAAASFTVNGGASQAATVAGNRVTLPGLPGGETLQIALTATSGGQTATFPLSVTTTVLPDDGKALVDNEMVCAPDTSVNFGPSNGQRLSLGSLQGGSASCGVVGRRQAASPLQILLVILIPGVLLVDLWRRPALRYIKRRGKKPGSGRGAPRRGRTPGVVLLAALAAAAAAPTPAKADEAGGLNVLQYRPVVDGVANTEKATTLPAGAFNGGVFASYASDPLELDGDQDKRTGAVMNNLVTAHMVGNVGLQDRVTLGVHIPYVHGADETRALSGTEQDDNNLGRPADIDLMLKINILKRQSFALAAAPLATIPTGDPDLLIGDGTANYGALFLVSGTQNKISWAYNAGYLQRQQALVLADDRAASVVVRGQYLNYAGLEYQYQPNLAFGGSLQAKFSAGENIDFGEASPAEWNALVKYRPAAGLELEGGGGTGIGKGYGSPQYRVFAGLTYVPDAGAQRARGTPSTETAKAQSQKAPPAAKTATR